MRQPNGIDPGRGRVPVITVRDPCRGRMGSRLQPVVARWRSQPPATIRDPYGVDA